MLDFKALPTAVLGELPFGAHHPPCPKHEHHLIWMFGHPLCLGCTSVYSGAVAGGCATFFLLKGITLPVWVLLCALGVMPTVLQPWLQYKPYKIFARFMLGVASAAWWLGAVGLGPDELPHALWTPLALLFFAAVAFTLLRVRQRFTPDPCHGCELGAFPTCAWNLERQCGQDNELTKALKDIGERNAWQTDLVKTNGQVSTVDRGA